MASQNLNVLVGLPASGKSTHAKKFGEVEGVLVLSSDELRGELLGDVNRQDANELVFKTLYQRARQGFAQGYETVVIDATNITMKSRRKLLSNFADLDITRVAIVFAEPIENCIARDAQRERHVGEHVIRRMMHQFEIPMTYEGFDYVCVLRGEQRYDIQELVNQMETFDQKNYHHKFSLGDHCKKCMDLVLRKTDNVSLINAARLHDLGKLKTQTFGDDGVAHYYSHHNVGAYHLLCSDMGADKELIFYVNFHMNPFFWKEEKTHNRYRMLFGDELYDNLMLLHECDRKASGTYEENNNA